MLSTNPTIFIIVTRKAYKIYCQSEDARIDSNEKPVSEQISPDHRYNRTEAPILLSDNTFEGGNISSSNSNMASQTVLVTGANRGIGLATAIGLARTGARVLVCGRSQEKADSCAEFVTAQTGNTDIHPVVVDLASLASIRTACQEIEARFQALHVLVNNAAVITQTRELSADGVELQLAVNHLAPFALTAHLLPLLERSAPARIVTVSSASHRRTTIDFDDLQFSQRTYNRVTAYSQSKLANILFTEELARRLNGSAVTANCLHPGVVDTGLLQDYAGTPRILSFALKLFKATERGARTSIYLASSPDIAAVSGRYFEDCKPSTPHTETGDRTIANRLWKESERLTGITYPLKEPV